MGSCLKRFYGNRTDITGVLIRASLRPRNPELRRGRNTITHDSGRDNDILRGRILIQSTLSEATSWLLSSSSTLLVPVRQVRFVPSHCCLPPADAMHRELTSFVRVCWGQVGISDMTANTN